MNLTDKPIKVNSWQVSVAAEAFAAALFAKCGLDVSVQYGANQPEYDLVVCRGERLMKVSVKGSQDGGWGLTQSYLDKGAANYHEAIDRWLARHNLRTVLCLAQFLGVATTEMPRMYLATPIEIAHHLKLCAKGRGETILNEEQVWTNKSQAAGTIDRIPAGWRFSATRVEQLLSGC